VPEACIGAREGLAGLDRQERDLTRRIEELERENRDLIDAVRARDDFIAIAAHELRNPMTPILGLVERLVEECRQAPSCPPAVERTLALLSDSIEVFVSRATTLLDVTRLRAGAPLHPIWLDFAAIVERAVQRYRRAAERVGSTLRFDSAGAVMGRWDPVAVQQVIDNLLSNAVKYGAGKPVRVGLHADGSVVRLTVADAGIGISPDDQARIFSKFEQVVRNPERGGFGIGLWVTRQLIEAMRGSIAVRAEPGRGSTFVVTLPIDTPAAEDAT